LSGKGLIRSIRELNKYRGPEVGAELFSVDNLQIVVKFVGSFCQTCGFTIIFDDFRIILAQNDIKTTIAEIREIENGAIIRFALKVS